MVAESDICVNVCCVCLLLTKGSHSPEPRALSMGLYPIQSVKSQIVDQDDVSTYSQLLGQHNHQQFIINTERMLFISSRLASKQNYLFHLFRDNKKYHNGSKPLFTNKFVVVNITKLFILDTILSHFIEV